MSNLFSKHTKGAVEIVNMGIAAIKDLNDGPIIAQNIATCYALILICKETNIACIFHVPDSFSRRMTHEEWGRDAFSHLVKTLRYHLVDNNEANRTIYGLVAGGTIEQSMENQIYSHLFEIALYVSRIYSRKDESGSLLRDVVLSYNHKENRDADVNALIDIFKPINFQSFKFDTWETVVTAAQMDFTPFMSHENLMTALVTLSHKSSINSHRDRTRGKKWAELNYPLRDEHGDLTDLGQELSVDVDFADPCPRELAESGHILKKWLWETPEITEVNHEYLNKRAQDEAASTVAIILESGAPVIYIWNESSDLKFRLNRQSFNIPVSERGIMVIPNASRISFSNAYDSLAVKLKHMGAFIFKDNNFLLVTTLAQYQAFLDVFGFNESDVPLSQWHTMDNMGYPILPDT